MNEIPQEAVKKYNTAVDNMVKLTEVVTEQHKKTKAEREQYDIALKKSMQEFLSAQVDAKIAEKIAPLGPTLKGDMSRNGVNLSKNKYRDVVNEMLEKGYCNYFGSTKLTPGDLYVALKYLNGREQFVNTHPNHGNSLYSVNNRKGASTDLYEALRALTPSLAYSKYLRTDVATQGLEWTPEETSRFIWEEFFTSTRLLDAFGDQVMRDMPSNPFNISDWIGDITFRKVTTQGVGVTPQTPTTGKSVLSTTSLMMDLNWTMDIDEDAVVSMSSVLRRRLIDAGNRVQESFLLNGDKTVTATGNINSDDATPPADSFYLAEGDDGIRKMWLVDAASATQRVDAAGVITKTILKSGLSALGKYYEGSILVMNSETYISLLAALDEVVTVDKFGPMATILNGQLGSIYGKPIIVSDQQVLTQADGRVDTLTANTKGQISIINPAGWWVGFKGGFEINTGADIRNRMNILVGSMRMSMTALGRTTLTHTAGIFNITN